MDQEEKDRYAREREMEEKASEYDRAKVPALITVIIASNMYANYAATTFISKLGTFISAFMILAFAYYALKFVCEYVSGIILIAGSVLIGIILLYFGYSFDYIFAAIINKAIGATGYISGE